MPTADDRRRSSEQRRLRIVHAAQRLFLENGVDKTTVVQICSEAGVAKGLFYWFFESKDALLLELMAAPNEAHALVEVEIGRRLERLVGRILRDLERRDSRLAVELLDARVRIGQLETQLALLQEAQASGRKRVTRAMLGAAAAILIAATTGAVEGASSAMTSAHATRASAAPSAQALVAECDAIITLMERHPGFSTRS